MCDPLTIATTLAVVNTAMSYDQARTQSKIQDYRHEQNKLNSQQAYEDQTRQNQIQSGQLVADNVRQQQENQKASDDASATAELSARESGATGLSLGGILRDIDSQRATNNMTLESNLDNQLLSQEQKYKQLGLQKESRINSVAKGQKVNALPYLLQIGSSIAGGMDSKATQNKTLGG